jgi:hypothetical protein
MFMAAQKIAVKEQKRYIFSFLIDGVLCVLSLQLGF